MRHTLIRWFAVGALWASAPALSCACGGNQEAAAQRAKVYSAVGVIKSFGPDRAFVNIAHENIPGYMAAMTMSFEPSDAKQLRALSVGERVRFQFVETSDARRVIQTISVQR